MRFKEIILERLTEWEWLPKAVSDAVDAAYNPPPSTFKDLATRTAIHLNTHPSMVQWKQTLDKPLQIINAKGGFEEKAAGFAGKEKSTGLIDNIKSLWNTQYKSWVVGIVNDHNLFPPSDAAKFKIDIENILGHELSHIKQFESEVRAGHVPPGPLKELGYDILATIRDPKQLLSINSPAMDYYNSNNSVMNPKAKTSKMFSAGLTNDELHRMVYRLERQEIDAWAYTLGSTLRNQFGEKAPAALAEIMSKIPKQAENFDGIILGTELNGWSNKAAKDLWVALSDAEVTGMLKGRKADIWRKFMKETSRYTIVQAADKLAAKAALKPALKRVATMTALQLSTTVAKRLPELALKGALKSIPYAGAVIGVAFAINSLIQGDVLGAGLELAGGLGSIATAIPATSYQAAREIYSDYYTDEGGRKVIVETDAVQDPEGTKQRIAFLYNKIYTELKAKFTEGSTRLTGAQGAANARNALRNMDTPGNPSPALHPELYPQQESLDRIINLSKYKS
jgi:hypothetical protein